MSEIQTSDKKILTATSSPHLHAGTKTSTIMWTVSLCLLPAAVWGVCVFGPGSLVVLLTSVISAVLAELAVNAIKRKVTVFDGSAVLTGLLVGLNMPPELPFAIPVLGSLFAILIVKHAFGGLGANWMNPALAGRVFVMFSFQGPMSSWKLPATLLPYAADATSTASPLGIVKNGVIEIGSQFIDQADVQAKLQSIGGSMSMLAGKNYPVTAFDSQITGWLNVTFGASIPRGYIDLFVGNVAGSIGEISVFFLLLGAVVLFIRKIISWEIPVSMLGGFALLVWIFGGLRFGQGLFHGDVFFQLFSGGLMLGAFFMATDYVTSPFSRRGKLIFGCVIGLLVFLIRFYGSLPEGVSLAIIIMNMVVPLIDKFFKPTIFGRPKVKKNEPKN